MAAAASDWSAVAERHVQAIHGDAWQIGRSIVLDDPPGIFCWLNRRDGGQYLDGPKPFLVSAQGITTYSHSVVTAALAQCIFARADDGYIIRALEATDPRDDGVFRDFAMLCVNGAEMR